MHYENKPIQIYWKFYQQKLNIFKKNSDIHISAQNIDCEYSLETLHPTLWRTDQTKRKHKTRVLEQNE